MLIISIQLIIYKVQCGDFFVYSYQGEGFNFTDPQIFNFLFSYQKGLFVYTPIFLLPLLGLYTLFKLSRYHFFAFVVPMSIVIYVLSSWWCWFYGGSFSSRVMVVEFIPLFALLLGIALQHFKKPYRNTLLASMLVVLFVCQIQIFQYRYYEIHWAHMNKEKYWKVFLRVDKLIQRVNG